MQSVCLQNRPCIWQRVHTSFSDIIPGVICGPVPREITSTSSGWTSGMVSWEDPSWSPCWSIWMFVLLLLRVADDILKNKHWNSHSTKRQNTVSAGSADAREIPKHRVRCAGHRTDKMQWTACNYIFERWKLKLGHVRCRYFKTKLWKHIRLRV